MIKERHQVRSVKRGVSCVYRKYKLWPDGPRGHFIDGRWITCIQQAAPQAHVEAVEVRRRRGVRPVPSMPTGVTT